MIIINQPLTKEEIVKKGGELLNTYWEETPLYKHIPFYKESSEEFVESFFADYSGYLELNVAPTGEARGMIAAIVTGAFFNSSCQVLENILTYVAPKYRGGMVGPKMIKNMIAWGEHKGAKHAHISTISGIGSGRTTQLYEKLGFTIVGSTASMPLGEQL